VLAFLVRERKTCPAKGEETENQDPLQPGVSLVLVPKAKSGGRWWLVLVSRVALQRR